MHQNVPSLLLNNHKSNNSPTEPTKKWDKWMMNITLIGKGYTAYAEFQMNATEMNVNSRQKKYRNETKIQLDFLVYFWIIYLKLLNVVPVNIVVILFHFWLFYYSFCSIFHCMWLLFAMCSEHFHRKMHIPLLIKLNKSEIRWICLNFWLKNLQFSNNIYLKIVFMITLTRFSIKCCHSRA